MKERRAKEDDTEVSPDSNTVCQWLGDITDLRPNPVTDGYHRESQPTTSTPTHTHTHILLSPDSYMLADEQIIIKIMHVQHVCVDSLYIF